MDSLSSGSLSYRPSVRAAERAIDFVYKHLPTWRDHPGRIAVESENGLTESLVAYLDDEARRDDQPFSFLHQPSAGGRRSLDFAARPHSGASNSFSLPALTVFEAKRLPAPEASRRMEYVVDLDKTNGGIQRFKFGKKGHGSGFSLVAMVGYVQDGALVDWLKTINGWIVELAKDGPAGGVTWDRKEQLAELERKVKAKIACTWSKHRRPNEPDVVIRHLWVAMG
jgi:hypothetical protein